MKCFNVSKIKKKFFPVIFLCLTWKSEENRIYISSIEICVNIVGKHVFCKASNANISDNQQQNKQPDLNIGVI